MKGKGSIWTRQETHDQQKMEVRCQALVKVGEVWIKPGGENGTCANLIRMLALSVGRYNSTL